MLEEVLETCIDQSDLGVVCCYSNKCNRWSTGQNRQARISGEGGREGGGRGGSGGEGGEVGKHLTAVFLVHKCTSSHTCTRTHTYTHTRTRMYAHTHTHTHVHTHTFIAHTERKNRTGMENGDSTTTNNETLETVAIISGAVCTFFVITAISLSLSVFYCYCCRDRRRNVRTGDVECGESPSPVNSLGPVAFQPQGERMH